MVQGAARGQTSARDPRGYPARAVRTTGTCPCTPNCTGTGILVPSQVSHGNTPHGAAPWGCLGLTRGRAVAGGSLHPPRWQEPSPATPGPFTPAARQMEPASPCLPHLTQSVPIAPGAQDAIQPRLLYAPDMWCPGFIPRAQHFFAKTYLEICKEARSDFARQQRRSWGGQEQPRACQPCLDPAQGSKVRLTAAACTCCFQGSPLLLCPCPSAGQEQGWTSPEGLQRPGMKSLPVSQGGRGQGAGCLHRCLPQ